MPATIPNIFALLDGLIEICSKEESIDVINSYFASRIANLKLPTQTDIISV
jgi:hypothetical protein